MSSHINEVQQVLEGVFSADELGGYMHDRSRMRYHVFVPVAIYVCDPGLHVHQLAWFLFEIKDPCSTL